jgi:hypothetical protein
MARKTRNKKATKETKRARQPTLFKVEDVEQVKGMVQINGKPKEEFIGMRKGENFPKVGFSSGVTLGIGNYQFVKIDIWAEIPSSNGDLEGAYKKVKDFVQEKLLKEIESIKNQYSNSSSSTSEVKE